MSQVKHVVWSQWPELKVPEGFTKLSPENFPLETSDLSEITIYVQPYMTRAELLEPVKAMTNLRLLQVPNAGYESAIPYVREGMLLCNAKGVHNASTAELAIGMAIAMKRGFPEFIRLGDQGIWSHERMGSLNDSNIGIIGAGSIGQTLVSYLTPYEVDITTFSRSGTNGSLPMERLDELLPADHPLWRAKNVMITPHVGGDSEAFEKRGRRFIESQLQRIADGLPPLNIIDLKGL
jgi:phosphoglycerate dehydrogenase-like enzyme